MDVLTPHSLAEALRLKAELPDARFVQGGTDVLVELNFDRSRPPALINLNEVSELRGFSRENGTLVLGAGLTYAEAMGGVIAAELPALAEASRTVGSPQIRNRGTLGGNLGTASPAGDALPPLLVEDAIVGIASVRGERQLPLAEFLLGVKKNALALGRARRQRSRRPEPGSADVHEGRPTKRDGDLRLLARAARRPRSAESYALRSVRPRPQCVSSPRRSTRPTTSRTSSPRARARSTTSAAPPRTGSTPSAS